MDQSLHKSFPLAALGRSEIRRWHVPALEAVRHHRPGQEWIPHWHAEWSIGAIVSGQCLCSLSGRPVQGVAGDLVVIAPQTVHTGALSAPVSTTAVSVVMLYVSPAWFAQNGITPPPASGFVPAADLANAAEKLRTGRGVERWLRRAISVGRQALSAHKEERLPSAASQALLTNFQSGLLAGDVSVSELVGRCQVSREHLHRVIRRWTGMSPAHYLRAFRVNRAREMLLDGGRLAAVAADCGFSDQAHFTRVFRAAFGYTPGDLLAAIADARAR
jgi:AraC-like DNA-binding protein